MKTKFMILVLFAFATTSKAHAQGWAELKKWEDKASIVRAEGPGGDVFRLRAEASWDKNAPKDAGRFQARIVAPNGKTETHPLDSNDEPASSARRVTFYIPASLARNIRPDALRFRLSVIDSIEGKAASNELIAAIDEFPSPESPFARDSAGRSVGESRSKDQARGRCRKPLRTVLVTYGSWRRINRRGFSWRGAKRAMRKCIGFSTNMIPRRGADEFNLERPDQPALNMSVKDAADYVIALTRADPSGISYRLPTRDEWLLAARAGRNSKFWWGNESTFPSGANFLGPEPSLPGDTTAPAVSNGGFRPNPWGLSHTFGNVAEWVRKGSSFVRVGGHFRTEKEDAGAEVEVTDATSTGPDAFVGVRPAFDLSAEEGANLARAALGNDPNLARIAIAFQPDRATVQLSGTVTNARSKKIADRRLERLWFVAAVVNEIQAPTVEPGKLARLSAATKIERTKPLGRLIDRASLPIRWAPILPVDGSEWWVNIFWNGGRFAHVMVEPQPGSSTTIVVLLDRERVPEGVDLAVALSLVRKRRRRTTQDLSAISRRYRRTARGIKI